MTTDERPRLEHKTCDVCGAHHPVDRKRCFCQGPCGVRLHSIAWYRRQAGAR